MQNKLKLNWNMFNRHSQKLHNTNYSSHPSYSSSSKLPSIYWDLNFITFCSLRMLLTLCKVYSWSNSKEHILLEKLAMYHTGKKFPARHGTVNTHDHICKCPAHVFTLCHMNPAQLPPPSTSPILFLWDPL